MLSLYRRMHAMHLLKRRQNQLRCRWSRSKLGFRLNQSLSNSKTLKVTYSQSIDGYCGTRRNSKKNWGRKIEECKNVHWISWNNQNGFKKLIIWYHRLCYLLGPIRRWLMGITYSNLQACVPHALHQNMVRQQSPRRRIKMPIMQLSPQN